MAASVLRRHDGIRFATSGRFKDDKSLLKALCELFGGTLGRLSKKTNYLILGKSSGTRTAERLNAEGAEIQLVPREELHELFALDTAELLELIRTGAPGLAALRTLQRALGGSRLPSLEKVNLAGANLRGLKLGGVTLACADFRSADLTEAFISGYATPPVSYAGANFQGAVLRGATVSYARLDGVCFRDADLSGVAVIESSFVGADFTGANLDRIDLRGEVDLFGARLEGVTLRGAKLSDSVKLPASLAGLDLSETRILCSLREVDLRGATLTLEGAVDLRGADLRGARFVESRLDGADLRGARLDGVELGETSMVCARLGPPRGAGRAGPAVERLRQLWRGKNASTTIVVELESAHTVELTIRTVDQGLEGRWELIGPRGSAMGLEDVETMCRWFGGEGGTPRLDRIRCRFDGEAHQSELEQLLRDVWSELFGVKSIDAEELEARRQAERSALQARRADLSEQGEPEILASLEADPDNEEMWLVYADWLQDHGDPRGEIIVREMQVSDERERRLLQRCLIDANPQLVIGDLAGVVGCQFEYRHAHIHRISINAGRQAARLCRRLAEHPATRFARCLRSSTAASAVIKPLFALVGARPIVDLSLHDTFFADTSPLGEHPKLRRLSLGYTRVHDAAPLEPLVNLESLDLYLARVTSLDALAGMTELRYLDLARTHSAESLAPIAGMKKLERLNIWSSAAANLETLLALDSLAWLRVHRGQLSEELLAALLEKRPDLEIDELGYEPR